jgi:hypothetical protein
MKTILEWYEELPEPIRSQAIKNCDRCLREVDSLTNAISRGFEWEPSPEKHDYWHDVYSKAEVGKYPTPPLEQSLSDLTKTLEEMKEAIESVRKAIGNEK